MKQRYLHTSTTHLSQKEIDKQWKEQWGVTHSELKDTVLEVEAALNSPNISKEQAKRIAAKLPTVWIRYIGPRQFYSFVFVSHYSKINAINMPANDWLKFHPGMRPGCPIQQYWADVENILARRFHQRDFEVSLENPHSKDEVLIKDKNYEIKGINPLINDKGVTINEILEAIEERYSLELSRNHYGTKANLIKMWKEIVDRDGVIEIPVLVEEVVA